MNELATQKQTAKLAILMGTHMIDREQFKKRLGIKSTKELSKDQISKFIDHYENLPIIF
jgi:prolyl-tRNA editing enzyme YbaK/EbsC (Cys-tRNA(Pro) deacylase)